MGKCLALGLRIACSVIGCAVTVTLALVDHFSPQENIMSAMKEVVKSFK